MASSYHRFRPATFSLRIQNFLFEIVKLASRLRVRREPKQRAPQRRPRSFASREKPDYLILLSRNSTCFLATGSYFFFTSFSVCVREFFLVT